MGSPADKYSQQQQDGLEDGEWRVPQSEGDRGRSYRDAYSQRDRTSSLSASLYRRHRDQYRGTSSSSYRDRDRDRGREMDRRGSQSLPPGRSSGPLRIGRQGPPLSARGSPYGATDSRDRMVSDSHSRPRFSMTPYHRPGKDIGKWHSSYKPASRDQMLSPRKIDSDGTRGEDAKPPLSSSEYQENTSKKATGQDHAKDDAKKDKASSLRRLGTVDILKSIKDLEDKKESVEKDIIDTESELSMLKASLPKLVKLVEKASRKAPLPPKSPTSLDISEENISPDDTDSDDSIVESSKNKGNRSRPVKSKSLQNNIESLAPEQRSLVSKLGNELRKVAEKSSLDAILSENNATRNGVELRYQKLYPAGYSRENHVNGVNYKIKETLARILQHPTKVFDGTYNVLVKDHIAILREHMLSGIRYRFAFENWRELEMQLSSPVHRTLTPATIDTHSNEPGSPLSRSMSRGRNRGVVRSDLEERIAIATLQAVEAVKTMTTLPTQIVLTERSARWVKHFYDWNRLLKNPTNEFDKDDIMRPWSKREKDVFAEKFLLYHKDFARIGSYLPSRTIPEIIKFYYAVQRSQEFEVTRRKWQLRKRREKAEESALQRTGTVSSLGSLPGTATGLDPTSNNNSNITEGGTKGNTNSLQEGTSNTHSGRKKKKTKRKKAAANSTKKVGTPDSAKVLSYFSIFPTFTGKGIRQSRKPGNPNFLLHIFAIKGDDMGIDEGVNKIAASAPHSFSTSNLDKITGKGDESIKTIDNKSGTSKIEKNKKKRRSGGDDTKSVGRGRLPSVDTDKKYIEAVQRFGRDFSKIAGHINKSVEAARKYWDRHCKRLGLLSFIHNRDPGNETKDEYPDYSLWSAVLEQIKDDTAALDDALLTSIPPIQWKHVLSVLDTVPHSMDIQHVSSVLVPELIQGSFNRTNEILQLLHAVKAYFQSANSIEKRKRERDVSAWSDEEKQSLCNAYKEHGDNWPKLQQAVPTKTMTQIESFYQEFKSHYFDEGAQSVDDHVGVSPDTLTKKQKTVDGSDDALKIDIPENIVASLPQGIRAQMEEVMTNPTARMQFNALMVMQQQHEEAMGEEKGLDKKNTNDNQQ